MNLEILMHENRQLRTEIEELTVKYELVIVQCEHLSDENEQLRVQNEHLTEEIDRIAVLCEQGRQGVQKIISRIHLSQLTT